MGGWGIAGLLIAFVAWSGFMYYEGGNKADVVCAKDSEKKDLKQASATIGAQKGVITTIGQQQAVSQGVDHDYQLKKDDIDYVYGNELKRLHDAPKPIPTPTGAGLPAASPAASRFVAAATRPLRSKVYKLNSQECDQNTAQLYSLQDWVKKQLAIKASPR